MPTLPAERGDRTADHREQPADADDDDQRDTVELHHSRDQARREPTNVRGRPKPPS
jgi:hypothetical protein